MNNTLPPEILECIFSYLPKNQFYECMKVCRQWYFVASEKRYEKIIAYPLYSQSMQYLRLARIDGVKIGNLVKICSFELWDSTDELQFQELIYTLANLRVMEKAPTSFTQFLNNKTVLDHLTHLEEISLAKPYLQAQINADMFFAINVRLKNQITSLKLTASSIFQQGGKYENVVTILSGFRALKHLRIGGYYGRRGIESIDLTSILNACSSLVSLELDNRCNWIIGTKHNQMHTRLSSLKLTVSNLTGDHLRYMMQKLPNLKDFTLWVVDRTFEEVLFTSNPSIVNEFAMFLKRMQKLEIRPTKRSFPPNSYNLIKVFFRKFLCGICNEGSSCNLEVSVANSNNPVTTTHLKKHNQQEVDLHCTILLNSTDYAGWVQHLKFFTIKSIQVHIDQSDHVQLGFICNWILRPLITLVKQQQYQQVPFIKFEDGEQKFEFGDITRTAEQSNVEHGYASDVLLGSKVLKGLGQLYPFVETLRFERCIIEEEEKMQVRTHLINLSQFGKLTHLTFDLDGLFPINNRTKPLFIEFVNVTRAYSYSFEYYYYGKKRNTLCYLGKEYEFPNTEPFYLLKIYHTGIKNFTFKRFNRVIYSRCL